MKETVRLVVQKTEHGTFALVGEFPARQIVALSGLPVWQDAHHHAVGAMEKRIAALEQWAKRDADMVAQAVADLEDQPAPIAAATSAAEALGVLPDVMDNLRRDAVKWQEKGWRPCGVLLGDGSNVPWCGQCRSFHVGTAPHAGEPAPVAADKPTPGDTIREAFAAVGAPMVGKGVRADQPDDHIDYKDQPAGDDAAEATIADLRAKLALAETIIGSKAQHEKMAAERDDLRAKLAEEERLRENHKNDAALSAGCNKAACDARDQAMAELHKVHEINTSLCKRINEQRKRITFLEGATNHAGGTPLAKAEAACARMKADRDDAVIERDDMRYSLGKALADLAAAKSQLAGSMAAAKRDIDSVRAALAAMTERNETNEQRVMRLSEKLSAMTERAESLETARRNLIERGAFVERGLQERGAQLSAARAECDALKALVSGAISALRREWPHHTFWMDKSPEAAPIRDMAKAAGVACE